MLRRNHIIAANLGDHDGMVTAIRGYLLHPATLMFFLLAPVLKLIRYMPLEFAVMGLAGDILFYAIRIVAYVLLSMRFMPVVLPWLMARNVPFFWSTFLFWLALLTVNYGVFHAIIPSGNSLFVEVERFSRIVIYSLFAHLMLMLVIKPIVLPSLGAVPDLVPYFWPVNGAPLPAPPAPQAPHAALICPDVTGTIRALRAQNQYVLVITETGSHLVRMTLRNAIERLPTGSGQQIHRSWWVSASELATARLDLAEVAFVAGPDRVYPVGKTYEAEILSRYAVRSAS